MKSRFIHSDLALCIVPAIVVVWLFGWLFVYLCGPIDFQPRLQASAQSPDGALSVKVYRQHVSFSPPEIDVNVKIFDQRGNLVLERKIFQESMWGELNNLFRTITFERDEIHVGPKFGASEYVAIKLADLKTAR